MFNCLKPSPPARGYGEGDDTVYHPGFIIPHETNRPGAYNYNKSYTENSYAKIFIPNLELPFASRDSGGVKSAARELKAKGCNLSIEPHFNSYNGVASGMELLVRYEDEESIEVARLFAETFASIYPDRKLRGDKGVKRLKRGARGRGNLDAAASAGMRVQVLSELFFGDNRSDFIPPDKQLNFWKQALKGL